MKEIEREYYLKEKGRVATFVKQGSNRTATENITSGKSS